VATPVMAVSTASEAMATTSLPTAATFLLHDGEHKVDVAQKPQKPSRPRWRTNIQGPSTNEWWMLLISRKCRPTGFQKR
jgi:hypothetical protein